MDKLLIYGLNRSGTTLLASLLGAHSDVNMLMEPILLNDEHEYLIGKRYQGIKHVYPHMRFKNKKGRTYNYLYSKFVWFIRFLNKIGITIYMRSGCKYSVVDFVNMNAKIIILRRSRVHNIESIVRRTIWSRKQAFRMFEKYRRDLNKYLDPKNYLEISFRSLTHTPEKALKMCCIYLGLEYEPKMLKAFNLNDIYTNSKILKKK